MSTLTLRSFLPAALLATAAFAATKPVTVELKDAKGQSVGKAVVSEVIGGTGVSIKLDVMKSFTNKRNEINHMLQVNIY